MAINYLVQRVDVNQSQLATWAGQVTGHQMHLSGSCPVCAHDSAIVVSQEFTAKEAAPASKIAALSLTCACDQSHPGQPDGISGCGRHWSCTATIGGNNRVTLSELNDPVLAAAADAFRAAGETQLADLRSAAQK